MEQFIQDRFSGSTIIEIPSTFDKDIQLVHITNIPDARYEILMTSGLSKKKMNVPETQTDKACVELFFCLPKLWRLDEPDHPNFGWPLYWLGRMASAVEKTESWFGAGHTMAAGNPPKALSLLTKQDHFILLEPKDTSAHLSPIEIDNKTIHFLAIAPIFENEFIFKQRSGLANFYHKMKKKNVTEMVDVHRPPMPTKRFGLF